MTNLVKRENLTINSLFEQLGMIITNNEETYNQLNVDQRIFQLKLNNHIKKDKKKFLDLLESYLDKETNFIISLLPTKVSLNCLNSHSSNQDSLIKILVEIDDLQTDLFELLITKTLHYCSSSDANEDKQLFNLTINIPTYIINQFRYQAKIINSDDLCQKFIELIFAVDKLFVKKELISAIPDIVGDTNHQFIAIELEKLLCENELLTNTLETLKYLKYTETTHRNIINKLFNNYNLISENELVSVVKYVLKSVIQLNSIEILNKLRDCVKFEDVENDDVKYLLFDTIKEHFQLSNQLVDLYTQLLTTTLTPSNNTNNSNNNDTNDSSSSNSSSNVVIKQINSFDFFLLTIIYQIPLSRKVIDKQLKQLIQQQQKYGFNRNLIKLVYSKCGICLIKEQFQSICTICKSLITNINVNISEIGCYIYKITYESMDVKYKQLVINSLIDHIINSVPVERENALQILYDLSINSNSSLNQFSVIIKILLDFIEYFNLPQISKLYFIMCNLAYIQTTTTTSTTLNDSNTKSQSSSSSSLSNVIQDRLYIMINKQLSSNQLKYKQMGCMGALMMIKCLSTSSSSSSKSLNTTVKNEIRNIWNMIEECSENSPESLALFEDNLSNLIRTNKIPETIENLLKETLKDTIKKLFKSDSSETTINKQYEKLFKLTFEFGLDNHTHGALYLMTQMQNEIDCKNILTTLTSSSSASTVKKQFISPITIASTFRLIASLERNNLNDLKDYLGIPIYCISYSELVRYRDEAMNKFKSLFTDNERKIICDMLFYLINWFIELVNAFCVCCQQTNSEEICDKLLNRLNTIIDLRELLKSLLPYMPYYKPPLAVFGLDTQVPYINQVIKTKKDTNKKSNSNKKQTKKASNKKPAKKAKISNDTENSTILDDDSNQIENTFDKLMDIDEDDGNDDDNDDKHQQTNDDVELSKLDICFREFDIELINLLNLPLELSSSDVSSINESTVNRIYIQPKLLLFILNDVNYKLPQLLKSNHSPTFLHQTQTKQTKLQLFQQLNTIKSNDLADKLINGSLNKLLTHLNTIYDHFIQIQQKYDGLKDAGEIFLDKNLLLIKCVNQLLKLLFTLYTWLEHADDKNLINDGLTLLSKQNKTNIEINIFKFLNKLNDIIIDLNSTEYLISLMDIICNSLLVKIDLITQANRSKINKLIADLCIKLLQTNYDHDRYQLAKKLNSDAIYKILKILFKNSDKNAINLIETFVNIMTSEDFMENRDSNREFATLKLCFNSYYKCVLEETIVQLKQLPLFDIKNVNLSIDKLPIVFESVKSIVKTHCALIGMSRERCFKEINMQGLLTKAKLFLDIFMKNSMSWIDRAFEEAKEQVIELLELLNKCALYLQDQCLNKEQLSKQTPMFMRSVEAFSLRVKLMLCVNRCDAAFTSNLHSGNRATISKSNAVKKGKKSIKVKLNVSTKKKSNKSKRDDSDDDDNDDNEHDESSKNNSNSNDVDSDVNEENDEENEESENEEDDN